MKNNKRKIIRAVTYFLVFIMLFSCLLMSACDPNNSSSSGSGESSENSTNTSSEEGVLVVDKNAQLFWKNDFSYGEISSLDTIFNAEYYFNGSLTSEYEKAPDTGDAKYLFGGENETRVVNHPDGYMFTMPGSNITTDFTLSERRSKFSNENSVLTISYEDKSPYGNNENGWNIYLTEWLNRYITNDTFLQNNNINYTRKSQESTDIIPGYTVLIYDYFIRLSANMEFPYYNIAIIRKSDVYDTFYLLVMKSKDADQSGYAASLGAQFDEIVKSFKVIERTGTALNSQGQYSIDIPDYWNEETENYYTKLLEQETVDWGAFAVSMPSVEANIPGQTDKLTKELEMFYGEDGFDYEFDIMPTYTHIAWYDEKHHFPTQMAEQFAGGNGFNGKPVLQFTYQFTLNNNGDHTQKTPMFDVLRGLYDTQFRKLAQDIKAYGKPVLFRLNNEMNTDWTSYAGILTMLDPDFFIMTWEYLYNIFLEEGVDNCIWIFNPIAVSCPYSNWGDFINYMPSEEYVQILGLTYYESGNDATVRSFKELYTDLYDMNSPFFINYPWVISEFACGAGGAKQYDWGISGYKDTVLARNAQKQAQWVKEMFDCFENNQEPGYEFCKNIKGAVWFSANDSALVGDTYYITNYFKLDDSGLLTNTFKAFREGLARTH